MLGAVLPVFVVIAAGFVVRHARWLTSEADASLLRCTVNLLYPCLVIDSVLGNPALEKAGNVLLPPCVGAFTIFLGYGLGLLGTRVLRLRDPGEARTFSFASGIYNYGYIAIPLVREFFNRETVGVLFTYNLGVEMAFWIGVNYVLAPPSSKRHWTKMFNPPVIAIAASVMLNLAGAKQWLPHSLLAAVHMLGISAVPLALVLTGATLADLLLTVPLRGGLAVYIGGTVIRSVAMPLLLIMLALVLPCSVELKQVMVVQAAMPAAMLPIIIARHYEGDANTALKITLATSLVGLITIPLWLRVGLHWVGL
jgi:hypothetical protein